MLTDRGSRVRDHHSYLHTEATMTPLLGYIYKNVTKYRHLCHSRCLDSDFTLGQPRCENTLELHSWNTLTQLFTLGHNQYKSFIHRRSVKVRSLTDLQKLTMYGFKISRY